MPISSFFLTRDASEKRGGGCVKCWSAATAPRLSGSASRIGGSIRPSSSSAPFGSASSRPSAYSLR